jgi:hypothetical protein
MIIISLAEYLCMGFDFGLVHCENIILPPENWNKPTLSKKQSAKQI